MPRPGPARALVNVRLGQSGIDFLAAEAARLDLTRSELIRRILAAYSTTPEPHRLTPGDTP